MKAGIAKVCRRRGLRTVRNPSTVLPVRPVSKAQSSPLVAIDTADGYFDGRKPVNWSIPSFDRLFDLAVAVAAFALFLPLILLIALAVTVQDRGPALFVQHRVGRYGKLFPCLKFRTMVVDARDRLEELLAHSEEARAEWRREQKLRNDPRITRFGLFLRKTSLDELPQLFNVIVGHMSVVGPRPIVQSEIPRYGARFGAYCSVRPGLTGLWQVSGRSEVPYAIRVRLDARYAQRKSLSYDLSICFRTIPAVLLMRGTC